MADEEYFLYKSVRNEGRAITIGQRPDLSFFLAGAHFLTPDENRFGSIKQIEEYIDDELLMIRKQDD
jgi:hypothetical protein